MTRVEAVANYQCKVGENPLWDEREGRPDLNVLYVTTAGGSALADDQAADGTLYRFQVEVPGTAPYRSRIRL
ncbi:MAG: hypothetical protein ABIQ16_04100 [Polyangiaceae bacterium]